MSAAKPVVTTIAGSGLRKSTDGIGTAASFHTPNSICYSEATDSLLITEYSSHRIRCVLPATTKRKALLQSVTSALLESGALPIQPLISIIHDYMTAYSMYGRSVLLSGWWCGQHILIRCYRYSDHRV